MVFYSSSCFHNVGNKGGFCQLLYSIHTVIHMKQKYTSLFCPPNFQDSANACVQKCAYTSPRQSLIGWISTGIYKRRFWEKNRFQLVVNVHLLFNLCLLMIIHDLLPLTRSHKHTYKPSFDFLTVQLIISETELNFCALQIRFLTLESRAMISLQYVPSHL